MPTTAYAIDVLFDKFQDRYDEEMMDKLMAQSEQRDRLADQIVAQVLSSYQNLERSKQLQQGYRQLSTRLVGVGETTTYINNSAGAMAAHRSQVAKDVGIQVQRTHEFIEFRESVRLEIEEFIDQRQVEK